MFITLKHLNLLSNPYHFHPAHLNLCAPSLKDALTKSNHQVFAKIIKHDSSLDYFSICDEKCIIDETLYSASFATCKVPAISNIYSNVNFKISTESENLKAGNLFGTVADFELAFDGKILETLQIAALFANWAWNSRKDMLVLYHW